MDDTALVFVYGSLKSGYWNNERCLAGALLVGDGYTLKNYLLVDGGVPFAIPAKDTDEKGLPIKGEVWEIDLNKHLPRLDALEGHPTFYTREQISVSVKGEVCNAFIYEMQAKHYHQSPLCGVVEDKYVWHR